MKFSPLTTGYGLVHLLVVALVSGLIARWQSDTPLPWTEAWSLRYSSQARAEGIRVVDTAEVRDIILQGTHLILDARPLPEYDAGHLPMAMSLPEDSFDQDFPNVAPILLPDGPILTYCSGPACDAALQLARRLRDAGYTNLVYYAQGYTEWLARGDAP